MDSFLEKVLPSNRLDRELKARVMTHCAIGIAVLLMCLVNGLAKAETLGPSTGALVIAGGGKVEIENIFRRFVELAGGDDAEIVIVPTAKSSSTAYDYENHKHIKLARDTFGLKNVTVVHTHDRQKADTDDFVRPLRKADGVWFTGGSQWRLADAYLGTLAEREFKAVLARGGVIGGSSAGASIQGSFLVSGGKGHRVSFGDRQHGFGFISNSAIDQHVIARKRQDRLITVLTNAEGQMSKDFDSKALLGIGIDEDTAIVVQGNEFEVIGKPNARVLVYDHQTWKPKTPDHKKYQTLFKGARYNLAQRKKLKPKKRVLPPPKAGRRTSGFYKEIFMSGGVKLSSRKRLPAAESLGLAYEYYAGKDGVKQNEIISGSAMDSNGALLYPDGQPRFRMIYVNGGSATRNGKSLEHSGRDVLRRFYKNGGSYSGSCAGSFLIGRNTDSRPTPRFGYLHLFPFNTLNTGMKKERVGHFIPAGSPLLQYRDFGNDGYVADIYHNNGNWLSVKEGDHLKSTEILATYDTPTRKPDQGAAIWAYKTNEGTGRIVNIGSHPEGARSGERLALTEACFLYALAGTGQPQVKGRLEKGVVRKMTKRTVDEEPAFTKIGDRQWHHFTFDVSHQEPHVQVKLSGEPGFDFHLYLNPDPLALPSNATYAATGSGSTKVINAQLSPGRWFASVECATTVVAQLHESKEYFVYSGKTAILNGVAYDITMTSAPGVDILPSTKQPADDLTGPPFVAAKAWGIADGKTGKLLWGVNEDLPCKVASTTKIMTAVVVLEMARTDPEILDEIVTYSKLADETIGSTSDINAGESLRVSECLYGLMLPSGNDAGNALAEHFNDRCRPSQDGSLPETITELGKIIDYTTRRNFVAEMNRRAKYLGMSNTIYRSPYGDGGAAPDRTTTVRDLLKLARAALQNPLFRKYVATNMHETMVQTPDGQARCVSWKNTNRLLRIESFDGIKTGTTRAAGACLVSSGRRGDDHLLVVVLGSTRGGGRYVDSKNLYRWAWRERGHRPPHGSRHVKRD